MWRASQYLGFACLPVRGGIAVVAYRNGHQASVVRGWLHGVSLPSKQCAGHNLSKQILTVVMITKLVGIHTCRISG